MPELISYNMLKNVPVLAKIAFADAFAIALTETKRKYVAGSYRNKKVIYFSAY